MPTYEYKNIETGELYEFKQSMRDDALTHHPETGAAIKRIVSVPGIAFKGSGFYANDSRAATSTAKAGAAKSEGAAGGESAAKTPDASAATPVTPAATTAKPAPSKSGE